MSFAVDPTNPQVLYAGEIDMFKSSDGGSSWTQLSGGGSGTSNMHVDQHNVQFIDGNKVIFSNDGGVEAPNRTCGSAPSSNKSSSSSGRTPSDPRGTFEAKILPA